MPAATLGSGISGSTNRTCSPAPPPKMIRNTTRITTIAMAPIT
jgi:hypothetical protein